MMKKIVLLLIFLLSITISSCSSVIYVAACVNDYTFPSNYLLVDGKVTTSSIGQKLDSDLDYYINRSILNKYEINTDSIYDNLAPQYIYDKVDNDLIKIEDFHYYFTKSINVICNPFEKQEYQIIPSLERKNIKEFLEVRYQNYHILNTCLRGIYKNNGEYSLPDNYVSSYGFYSGEGTRIKLNDTSIRKLDSYFVFDSNLPIYSLKLVFNLKIDNRNLLCSLFIPIYYDLLNINLRMFDTYYYEKEMKLINNEIEEYDLKIYLKYNNKDYLINQLTYIRDVTHNYYYANYESIDPNNYPKYDKDGNIYRTTYIPFEFYLNNEDKLVEYAETFRDNMRKIY